MTDDYRSPLVLLGLGAAPMEAVEALVGTLVGPVPVVPFAEVWPERADAEALAASAPLDVQPLYPALRARSYEGEGAWVLIAPAGAEAALQGAYPKARVVAWRARREGGSGACGDGSMPDGAAEAVAMAALLGVPAPQGGALATAAEAIGRIAAAATIIASGDGIGP